MLLSFVTLIHLLFFCTLVVGMPDCFLPLGVNVHVIVLKMRVSAAAAGDAAVPGLERLGEGPRSSARASQTARSMILLLAALFSICEASASSAMVVYVHDEIKDKCEHYDLN